MNKIEETNEGFRVARYDGTGFEYVSKPYIKLYNAQRELERINQHQNNNIDQIPLIKQMQQHAINDVMLAKKHKNIAITDTKCGVVYIEYWNNIFCMSYGEKLLHTDNELMIVEVLKGLYKFTIESLITKKNKKNFYLLLSE